jgi:glycosyltransferase involved in cell wall biosynthesis
MASACAIVAPDQANIREVLRHEETALLFDASVPGAMWAAVTRLVDDPILRRRIGRAARDALIADQRTWPANAARVLAIAEGCRSAGSCVSQDATGTHRSDAAAVGLAR